MADIDPIFEAQRWIVSSVRNYVPDIPAEIYSDPAPESASYPFLVMRYLGGATMINNGATIVWDDLLFLVEAYSDVDDISQLAPITTLVKGALHSQFGTTSAARIISCVHESPTKNHEAVGGSSLLRLGGQYRLRLQAL